MRVNALHGNGNPGIVPPWLLRPPVPPKTGDPRELEVPKDLVPLPGPADEFAILPIPFPMEGVKTVTEIDLTAGG